MAIPTTRDEFGNAVATPGIYGLLVTSAERARLAAERNLDFTDIIDDQAELEMASDLREIFQHAARFFYSKPIRELSESEIEAHGQAYLSKNMLANLRKQFDDAQRAADFYARRLLTL